MTTAPGTAADTTTDATPENSTTSPAPTPEPAAGTAAPGDPPERRTTAAARQALGAYGERVAVRHLVEAGLVLLDRNWRCEHGEIDLVLREGAVLVVCEVKTRSSLACGFPHEAITGAKLTRLQVLGQAWATAHDVRPEETRVDLVAVLRPRRGPAQVEHVRGIG